MIGCFQVLQAVFDPFHRPFQRHRGEGDQKILRIKLPSYPKSSADIELDEVDLGLGYVEKRRQDRPVEMRYLGGPPHGKLTSPGIVARHQPARLEWIAGMTMDLKRFPTGVWSAA